MATRKRTIQSNPLDHLTKASRKTFEDSLEVTALPQARPKKPKAALTSAMPAQVDRLAKQSFSDLSNESHPKRQVTVAKGSAVGTGCPLSPLSSNTNFAQLRAVSGKRLYVRYVHNGRICRSTLVWSRKLGEGVGFFDEQQCFISLATLHGPLKMEDFSERFGVLAILAVLGGGILGCAAVSLMMHNALQAFRVVSDSMPNRYVLLSRESSSTLVSAGVSVLRGP